MKSCLIVFDALSVGEVQASSFAALQALWSSLALAFHTRSAVKACDCPQTLQPTAPLIPCCLANYEYSAMKVILSDMQLSSQIVSAVLFGVFEGRIPLGRVYSSPFNIRFSLTWPKYNILDFSLSHQILIKIVSEMDLLCCQSIYNGREHGLF